MSMMLDVKDELKKLQRRMERISGFLESAERKRHEDRNINNWVVELKDVMHDADDIIDRCMMEGRRLLEDHPSESAVRHPLSLFSCFSCIRDRNEIGKRIKELNDRLKEIQEDRSNILSTLERSRQGDQLSGVNHRQTFSMEIKSDIVGAPIEEATQSLVESLTKEDHRKCRVFGIVETELLKDIIRDAGGKNGEAETKAELVPRLSSILSKRFFIVLDDVWEKDVWEKLLRYAIENAAATGKILITTRHTNVASNIRAKIHQVDKMDNDSCWKLLHKNVFEDDDEEEEEISRLKEIGVQIVEKCDGLPLAIKVIAGVLRSKERSNLEWNKVLKSEVWSMSELDKELPGALFLSYDDLSSDLKQCFLYCSLFPEDSLLEMEDLIRYWVAEGFVRSTQGNTLMEDVAEDYYRELIGRNLLHVPYDDTWCTMHDPYLSFWHGMRALFLGTPLTHVPKGIGKLKHLNHLEGFVMGHRRGTEDDEGCDLEELQSLSSQLRFLEINRLERTEPKGAPVLANSNFLRALILNCEQPEDDAEAIAIQRIDKIYNIDLSPRSTHLQRLEIYYFFGSGFPSWMMSPSLDVSFPNLTNIILSDCKSCPQLPPLHLLPQLRSLYIGGAGAIKTIGPEFLGSHASSAATSFHKLEQLSFYKMCNWEEWSFGMVEGVGEERRGAPKLLPRLKELFLIGCPKLKALPEGLRHATNLQELYIAGVNNLKEINNLPSLKSLQISFWPHVENLDKLQLVRVRLPDSIETSTTDADGQTERLPQWLLELLQNAPAAMQNLQKFKLTCSLLLLKTFLKDGPNWPIIQPIPQVEIHEPWHPHRSSSYVRYTKDPPTFEANVVESEESVD
ncbi:putative disease resistance protein RGA1 [Cocos nucifera]|uniref:Putative disease resistance protein RGA1 n=1 Tax=Cocos nucifera TaxID=13894 RepID=A0A8K0IK44_COCNU|nr:putative disease resistance protein RGA1 [Cocos nucifera]